MLSVEVQGNEVLGGGGTVGWIAVDILGAGKRDVSSLV